MAKHVPLLAGFECGMPHGHDLLKDTRHIPPDSFRYHYHVAYSHGIYDARDGLLDRMTLKELRTRIAQARVAGFNPIWDLMHYDEPKWPELHAGSVVQAFKEVWSDEKGTPLRVIPVNEPTIHPSMGAGGHILDALRMGANMLKVLRDNVALIQAYSSEPLVGSGEQEWMTTDTMVQWGMVDVVGVNYYPHTAVKPLSEVLIEADRRYSKPVMVTETSWHTGHPEHGAPRWPNLVDKGDWLMHIYAEVAIAQRAGVDVRGVCWYPFVDCPPWGQPGSDERWSHGFIDKNGQLDGDLACVFAAPLEIE